MSDLKQIISLARQARQQIKKLANIHSFNLNGTIPTDTMKGACGIVSLHTLQLAKKHKLRPTFVHGLYIDGKKMHGHCWVEYNGKIIDPTATQFNKRYNKVHVVAINNKHYKSCNKYKGVKPAYNMISSWCYYPDELKNM